MSSKQIGNAFKVALIVAGSAAFGAAFAGTVRGTTPKPTVPVQQPQPTVIVVPVEQSAPPTIVDPSVGCQSNGQTTASRC